MGRSARRKPRHVTRKGRKLDSQKFPILMTETGAGCLAESFACWAAWAGRDPPLFLFVPGGFFLESKQSQHATKHQKLFFVQHGSCNQVKALVLRGAVIGATQALDSAACLPTNSQSSRKPCLLILELILAFGSGSAGAGLPLRRQHGSRPVRGPQRHPAHLGFVTQCFFKINVFSKRHYSFPG